MNFVELVELGCRKDYPVEVVAAAGLKCRISSLVLAVGDPNPKCQKGCPAEAVAADSKCRKLNFVEVVELNYRKDYSVEAVAVAGLKCRTSSLVFAVVDPKQKDYSVEAAVAVQIYRRSAAECLPPASQTLKYPVVTERPSYIWPRAYKNYVEILTRRGWAYLE